MPRFELVVEHDDGTIEEVTAGQREMAAWERETWTCGSLEATDRMPMVFFRYLAYAALKRLRRLPLDDKKPPRPLSFDAWSDEVENVETKDKDDEPQDVDPTPTDQPAEG